MDFTTELKPFHCVSVIARVNKPLTTKNRQISGCLFHKHSFKRKSVVFHCIIFENLIGYISIKTLAFKHVYLTRSKTNEFIHQVAFQP